MRRFAASLRRTCALAAALTLVVALPAAAETIAPPGNSGVDQYFEVVPSAKGNSKPDGKRKALPQKVRSDLADHGETGRQLQRVVETTAPARPKRERKPKPSAPAPPPRGDSPLSSAVKAFGDSSDGGMGLALPLLLIVSTAVLAAVALRRRRSA
jgi:hypothetical protein